MKQYLVRRVTNTGAPALQRALTPAQFGDLADIPPELEWLANLTNPGMRPVARGMPGSAWSTLCRPGGK